MLAVLSNIINDHEMLSFSQEKQEKKHYFSFLHQLLSNTVIDPSCWVQC